MTLRLADICQGNELAADGHGSECECGLPWDPARGYHTRSGIRLPPDIYSRILAREGEAIETEERRAEVRATPTVAQRRTAELMAVVAKTLRIVRRAP